MTIPLSLVCAKLLILDLESGSNKFSCTVASCDTVIAHDRLVKAELLSCRYLDEPPSQKDEENLCNLAQLHLCPNHEENFQEIAQRWGSSYVNDDIFQLFKLKRNPYSWKCYAENCDSFYHIINHEVALAIIEKLTLYVLAQKIPGKSKTLTTMLSGLLHCRKHSKEACFVGKEWIQKLNTNSRKYTHHFQQWITYNSTYTGRLRDPDCGNWMKKQLLYLLTGDFDSHQQYFQGRCTICEKTNAVLEHCCALLQYGERIQHLIVV